MKVVKSTRSGNSFTWTFVKIDGCHICVYKLLEEQCIVYLADEEAIKDMTVSMVRCRQDGDPETWSLWLAAASGRLYQVDESKLNQKASSPSNQAASDAMEVEEETDDIFDDLLATQAAGLSNEPQSEQRVIILRHSHAVCKLTNDILSLCSMRDLLFVAHYSDEKYYSIIGYRKLDLVSNTPREGLKYIVKYDVPYLSCDVSSLSQMEHILMYCVESNTHDHEMTNSETLTIPVALFGHLFGQDASLMDTAVLLFALPNGIVHFFNLKSITSTSSTILEAKFPQILCDSKSTVVDVHSLRLETSSTNQETSDFDINSMLYSMDDVSNPVDLPKHNEPNVVLVVSESGRCVLIQESETSVPRYHTVHLVEPVSCSLSNGHELFCSFTHGVQRVVFKTSVDISNTLSWWPHYRNWNVAGVEGMSFVSNQMDSVGKSNPSLLLCRSYSGTIFTTDTSAPRDITRAGQRTSAQQMKDLLTSISNTSSKINAVHKELDRLQKILSQISIACHMHAGYTVVTIDVSAKFVTCVARVTCTVYGANRRDYQIVCRITNVSKAILSADWAWVVQCTHYQDFECKQAVNTQSKTLSFSQEFRPEAWEDIVIPVNTEHLRCPIFTVNASLLYHVGAAVKRDCVPSTHESLLDFEARVLTVPLNENHVDLIHFISDQMLGVSSSVFNNTHDAPSVLPTSDLSHISTSDLIMSMARQRPAYVFHEGTQNFLHSKSQDMQTLTVHVPEVIHRQAKSQLLSTLLSDSQIAVSTMSDSSVKLLTPNGHYIQLELGGDKTLALRSTDMLSLVQLRHALMTRMENLKRSSGEISRQVPADKSRKYIEQIQVLEQSLSDIMQVAAAKTPTDRAKYVLEHGLKIYHSLRDIDLV